MTSGAIRPAPSGRPGGPTAHRSVGGPSAVAVADGVDRGLAWHYHDPLAEQRRLARGDGVVDLSNRDVLRLTGAVRLVSCPGERALLGGGKRGEPSEAGGLRRVVPPHFRTWAPPADVARPTPPGAAAGRALADGSWLADWPAPAGLASGGVEDRSALVYWLDPDGHVEFDLHVVETDEATWLWTEPGRGAALAARLARPVANPDPPFTRCSANPDPPFTRCSANPVPIPPPHSAEPGPAVELRADVAVVWLAGGGARPPADRGVLALRRGPDSLGGSEIFIDRAELADALTWASPAGIWAYEARRIAAGVPRLGLDTGADRPAVPPSRRLVRLHLDGSTESFVAPGTTLLARDGRPVGSLGSTAYHADLGPIGLALVDRDVPDGCPLTAGGVACAVESLS